MQSGRAATTYYKDESLDHLAAYGNVAQFASFDPHLKPRFSRIADYLPNEQLQVEVAVRSLFAASPEGRLNVRSFRPDSLQGNEFIYGLSDAQRVVLQVRRLASLGLFVIVNETVDVNDGGVSGVLQGPVIEFAPSATPRVVDEGRPASLARETGLRVLESVYGFAPELKFPVRFRVEFSVHPVRRGWRRTHTIIWELQELDDEVLSPMWRWPNDFSEFVGDKVFGLLVADGGNFHVPRTTVLSRHLPPFTFGRPTGTGLKWIRTSPRIATPGRFSTVRGWADPFKLLAQEDPGGTQIPSVLVQDEVNPIYSGALLTDVSGEPIIEGVPGRGDALMVGSTPPVGLPTSLQTRLKQLHESLRRDFGSIRLEWVFDGEEVWTVQLQQEAAESVGTVIVNGDFKDEITFRAEDGLEQLRTLTANLNGKRAAIKLIGSVGMTSHMADILRRSHIPSRLVRQ